MNKTTVIFKRIFDWFLYQRDKTRRGRTYLNIKRRYMLMSWNLRNISGLKWLSFVVYIIISMLIVSNIAVAAGEIKELTSLIFELAKIFAIIGGLVLAGGFFATSSNDLKFEMRQVGTFYLLAAISFIILGLSLPIYVLEIKGITNHVFAALTFVSMIAGIASFAWATSRLTIMIPKLLRK